MQMSYLRSRRFYMGVAVGLLPFILLATLAASGVGNGTNAEGDRVVVRNYQGPCADSIADQRTAALLEVLPKNTVLVENFLGCCCPMDEVSRVRRVEPRPDSLTGVGQRHIPAQPAPAVPTPDIAPAPDMLSVIPVAGRAPGAPAPEYMPVPAEERRFGGAWLGLVGAPLVFFTRSWWTDREFPEGVICPDDTGPPTGEGRPRC